MTEPKNEHERTETLTVDRFYPDHSVPRKESKTFVETKRAGHKAKLPCCISGQTEGVEYHHVFCEWADAEAVDWEVVKGVATGKITELPVLDLVTDKPTGKTYPAWQSLLSVVIMLTRARGFVWETFDPAKPETFVDSMANMIVLHEKFHRARDHGIHMVSAADWGFQIWPRKVGFVFTPDEEQA